MSDLVLVSSLEEPTTKDIDNYVDYLHEIQFGEPAVIVMMGGGSTMDVAKAVSNLRPTEVLLKTTKDGIWLNSQAYIKLVYRQYLVLEQYNLNLRND